MNDKNKATNQGETSEQLHLFQMELDKYFEAREKHVRRMNIIFNIQLVLLVTTLVVAILRLLK